MSADNSSYSSGLNDIEHRRAMQFMLDAGVPEEWAVMIADRATTSQAWQENPAKYLLSAFPWFESPEGYEYWRSVYYAICAELDLDPEL